MQTDKYVMIVFAVGLVLLAAYALYLNQTALGATCIGAIAGVFTLGSNKPTGG